MNTKLTFLALLIFGFSNIFAFGNEDKNKPLVLVKSSASEIEVALKESIELSNLIDQKGLDFNALKNENPEAVQRLDLSNNASEEMVVGKDAEDLFGVPGIIWGLLLGLLGVLLVYLLMDEGSDRKKQVRMAFLGCLISVLIFGGYTFLVSSDEKVKNDDSIENIHVLKEQRA